MPTALCGAGPESHADREAPDIARSDPPFGASIDLMPIKDQDAQTWEFCTRELPRQGQLTLGLTGAASTIATPWSGNK